MTPSNVAKAEVEVHPAVEVVAESAANHRSEKTRLSRTRHGVKTRHARIRLDRTLRNGKILQNEKIPLVRTPQDEKILQGRIHLDGKIHCAAVAARKAAKAAARAALIQVVQIPGARIQVDPTVEAPMAEALTTVATPADRTVVRTAAASSDVAAPDAI
jgi:hypothetical protein